MAKKFRPIHPGEILFEEFLKPLGITPYKVAKDLGVPTTRIADIIHQRRGVSADTALRLSRYFGLSKDYWMGLQSKYDLACAEDTLGKRLEKEVRMLQVA